MGASSVWDGARRRRGVWRTWGGAQAWHGMGRHAVGCHGMGRRAVGWHGMAWGRRAWQGMH